MAKNRRFSLPSHREHELRERMVAHNRASRPDRHVTLPQLLAVYRRGAQEYAFMPIVAGAGHHDWAIARVDAFLSLLRRGRPTNSLYVSDNDLLPVGHPCSSCSDALTASAAAREELELSVDNGDDFSSPEDAILALSEYSGLGYDAIPVIRSVWLRAVSQDENPFARAKEFATKPHDSKDADLLPFTKKKMDVS